MEESDNSLANGLQIAFNCCHQHICYIVPSVYPVVKAVEHILSFKPGVKIAAVVARVMLCNSTHA